MESFKSDIDRISIMLKLGANSAMDEIAFLEREIDRWRDSKERKNIIIGEKYYRGKHDILDRKRQVIGRDGRLETVSNLPNNKIVHNLYADMVDQKTNYLLGKPFSIKTEDEEYEKALSEIFDMHFRRVLKGVGEDALNGGLAWLYVYYNENSELSFKAFEPWECLPFWADSEHTKLELLVRVYEVEVYEGTNLSKVEKVEVYWSDGIDRYELQGGKLIPDVTIPKKVSYIVFNDEMGQDEAYNWERVPIIPFRANSKEMPLIKKVKSLQDGINIMYSDFENNMQEDNRNTILVLKNYDGADLGEFRRNLSTYGAIKVTTVDKVQGGVEALHIEVNSGNYKTIIELFKKALIENAKGYDAKDDRLSGNPNQMNILSMYSDIDLDANGMEVEFQAAFESLRWFVDTHFKNTGWGDFSKSDLSFVFNRDILMNQTEIMDTLLKAGVELSQSTLLSQVPFVENVQDELDRIAAEKEQRIKDFGEYNESFALAKADEVEDEDNAESTK